MGIVVAHFHQMAAVFAAELDFDPAVALAQNARCGLPVSGGDTGNGEIS
jgi:hypothetical protein